MTDYSNWKVLKSVINYYGNDEEKQQAAKQASDEYTEVAAWCTEGQQYMIVETELYYEVQAIPAPLPPTDEEIRQMRERAYEAEVDPITAHIQRLRDTTAMTPDVENEIAELIAERDAKVAAIKERYPYNDGGE